MGKRQALSLIFFSSNECFNIEFSGRKRPNLPRLSDNIIDDRLNIFSQKIYTEIQMNRLFLSLTLLSFISSPVFAAESKGVVVLNHKSWITVGNDPSIHVIEGHITEKKKEK